MGIHVTFGEENNMTTVHTCVPNEEQAWVLRDSLCDLAEWKSWGDRPVMMLIHRELKAGQSTGARREGEALATRLGWDGSEERVGRNLDTCGILSAFLSHLRCAAAVVSSLSHTPFSESAPLASSAEGQQIMWLFLFPSWSWEDEERGVYLT